MANETKRIKPADAFGAVRTIDRRTFGQLIESISDLISGTRFYYLLLGLGILLIYIAAMFGVSAMSRGYREVYGISREIPWGILISTYVFFVVTSTGLCIISSLGHIFGVKQFLPVGNRAVYLAVVLIFAGFSVIFFDIENPFRMAIYNIISPNFTSNIWWMGTLYGAVMFFMWLEFIFLLLHWHRFAIITGLAGLIADIAAISNLGAIFGMLHSKEYWFGPYIPIYFIASAIMSGCAAIIIFTFLGYKINNEQMDRPLESAMQSIAKLAALMIVVLFFFTAWNVLTGLVGGEGKRMAILAMLKGPYAINFYVFEILIGMVIPFVMLLKNRFKDMRVLFTASLLMIVGIFFMRYDLVVVGQIVPVLYELDVKEYSGLLSYRPSIHEIMLCIGGLGIVATAFLIGEKVFKGHKSYVH
ncbi:MAG: polysulfide reductase NrfD [Nitrospirae bacterium]|nr:polysulfide reductase NrfD [Nitrospirota bacterium]